MPKLFKFHDLLTYFLVLGGLAVIYGFLAAYLPPADDELYYWCWSQDLQLSYYDHPPMSAYMIRASTEIFGDTLFAIRFPALVSTLIVLAILGFLTQPRRFLAFVLPTPLYTFGAILITPDTPLLLFWAAYLAWLVALHRTLDDPSSRGPSVKLWILGGIVLGCGMLGKYTTGLLVPAGFLSLVFARVPWSRWFLGYAFHGVVSFIVFLPVVIFNYRLDFAPIKYQWGHAMATEDVGIMAFMEFIGVQILLFGTLPVLLYPVIVLHARRMLADPRLRVCFCLFVFPFGFFVYKSLRGPIEGNWALASFIGFWPLAAEWYGRVSVSGFWIWFTRLAFAIPIGCVVVLTIHLIRPIEWCPPKEDRITRQFETIKAFKEGAEAIKSREEQLPVYVASYQHAAMLRFFGVNARQIEGATRNSHFTMRSHEQLTDADRAYFFGEGIEPQFSPGFAEPKVLGDFQVIVRGEEYTRYWLLLYVKSGK